MSAAVGLCGLQLRWTPLLLLSNMMHRQVELVRLHPLLALDTAGAMGRACLLVGWDPEALPTRAGSRPRHHQALSAVQSEPAATVVGPDKLGGSSSVIDVHSGSS